MAEPVEMQFGMCTCGAQETRVLGGCPGRGTFGSNTWTCPDLSAVDILNLNRNGSAAKQSLATSTPS